MKEALLEADRRARESAVATFDRHMILEAGAGTGKTSVLVDRVVAWSLGPGYDAAAGASDDAEDAPRAARVFEGIAALTFSEAAAAEMESRIAAALRDVVASRGRTRPGFPVGLGSRDRARAAERAARLLDHCDRLQVSTIHSFCRRLLVAFPFEAGVAPGFQIDAAGRVAQRIAREVLDAWLSRPNAGALDDLGALVATGCGPAEIEALLQALLLGPLGPEEFAADPLAPEAVVPFFARLRAAARALAAASEPALGDAPARTLRLLDAGLPEDAGALEPTLARLREIWGAAHHGRLDRLAQRIPAAALLRRAGRIDVGLLRRLHRVLSARFVEAAQAQRAEGALGFDELLVRARDLLRHRSAVAARVRGSLRQLLVDEFQDTDQVQCEIIEALALADNGPTLFVVGDPKQSIYAWRSADLRAYDAFLDRLGAVGAERHRLAVNHRSRPVILDEVERCLAPVMVREPGLQPEFQPLLASPLRSGTPPASNGVEYWIAQHVDGAGVPQPTSSAESLALEARALVEDLWRVHREESLPWREFAILLRSTGELDRYLDALRRAGIPYAVDRDRVYFRRREVIEARALLRLVIDPNDDLAWVATLRSGRCGVPDAAWMPLFEEGAIDLARDALASGAPLCAALQDAVGRAAGRVEALAVPGLDALAGWKDALLDAIETLVALRRSYEADPFEQFLARARRLALLDISEGVRFLGRYRIANLDRFFRETAELYAASGGDASALLRELRREDLPLPDGEESRPPGAGTDAVQVMTIHGAKGLDFEHVYLLQAHKGSAQRSDDRLCTEVLDGRREYALRWGPRGDAVATTLDWDRVEARRVAVARSEQVRTLYVAMTRAKTRLVVSGRLAAARSGAARNHADCIAHRLQDPLAPGVVRRVLGAEALPAPHPIGGLRAPPSPRSGAPGGPAVLPLLSSARREHAWARGARPYTRAASSAVSRSAAIYEESASPAQAGAHDFGGSHGAAIGTAIHAFLEVFDFDHGNRGAAWDAALEVLRARLANRVPPRARAEAERAAVGVLEAFHKSSLWTRFEAIQGHILGREVPLLARPALRAQDRNAPVGSTIGAIDLLYREPPARYAAGAGEKAESGRVVVVDFKSDRVDGEEALQARAAHYAPQGRVYCDAVADALALAVPPRFELWFLAAGRVVARDFGLPAAEAKPAQNSRSKSAQLR